MQIFCLSGNGFLGYCTDQRYADWKICQDTQGMFAWKVVCNIILCAGEPVWIYIWSHSYLCLSVCLSLSVCLCLSVSLHWKRHQFAAPLSLSLSFCLYIVISCLNCYFSCSAFNRGHLVTVQYYLIQAKDENIIHLPGWGLYAAFTTEVSLTAAHVPWPGVIIVVHSPWPDVIIVALAS